jgi:hypothetical protein
MAKKSGLGAQMYIGGYDLSNDLLEVSTLGSTSQLIDMTGIDKSAHERILGLVDGEIAFKTFFNKATGRENLVLRALNSGADLHVMYANGSIRGDMMAALVSNQINYSPTRSTDGALRSDVQCLGDGFGLDFGRMLTAGLRTDSSATNGASLRAIETGSPTAFGLAAYIHCTAFAGTNFTATIQESDDDASSDAYAAVTGGAFAAISAANRTERIVTGLTLSVEEYLRIVTTGTFSSAIFAVGVTRSPWA